MSEVIDSIDDIRQTINTTCGKEGSATVRPILSKLMENAKKNTSNNSTSSFRYENVVKKFASAL